MTFSISALKTLKYGEIISEQGGLLAEGLEGGRVAFRLQKRIRGQGKSAKKFLLGKFPDTSIQQAREIAAEYRRACDAGNDPRKTIEAARAEQKALDQLATKTLRDAFKREYTIRNPIKSAKNYEYVINGVSPDWWDISIRSITEEMVEERYYSYKKKTGRDRQAQQWVNILRIIFKKTARWKIGGLPVVVSNPMDVIDAPTQAKQRQGHLLVHELHDAIEEYANRSAHHLQGKNYPFAFDLNLEAQHHALCLLAFTGLRMREVLSIKWNDYYPKGRNLRGETIKKPLLRVLVSKTRESTPTAHFIPVTPVIEDILKNQKLIFTTFLDGSVKPEQWDAWDNGLVFFSHGKKNVPIDDCDVAVDKWRLMIGEPEIWKILAEDGKPKDKRDQFSAHWLRHTFTTICTQLGFTTEDVARAIGKKITATTSQEQYSHDYAVETAENSRAMYERVQAYIMTEAFQSWDARQYFKAHTSGDIDLSDPEVPPAAFDEDDLDPDGPFAGTQLLRE